MARCLRMRIRLCHNPSDTNETWIKHGPMLITIMTNQGTASHQMYPGRGIGYSFNNKATRMVQSHKSIQTGQPGSTKNQI